MIPLKSDVTKKILNYFFINPQEELYVNELSRQLKLDKRNLVKKVKELEAEGILKHQMRGNLKLYSINKEYALYDAYRKIIITTVGFEDQLRKALENTRGIKEAYLYGSYAKNRMDAHSDIDLLVVGSQSVISVHKAINELQKTIGREINVNNMDEKEFKKRLKDKDPFLLEVLRQKHIRLI